MGRGGKKFKLSIGGDSEILMTIGGSGDCFTDPLLLPYLCITMILYIRVTWIDLRINRS